MYKVSKIFFLFITFIFTFFSCSKVSDCKVNTDEFNSDTAFFFIEKQVAFGSRVPNTIAHDSCAIYLSAILKKYGANVYSQKADVIRFDGEILKINNIIGEFFPEKNKRLLLFAHWDSRFYADFEEDSLNRVFPIDGANDGASGVAVLLEIARQISINEPQIGVDIILFDAEDQGEPVDSKIFNEKSWSLGAQYWANHLHKKNYEAFLGINLDMVGGENAIFAQEDNSRYFNNYEVKRIWKLAKELGYEKYFVNQFSQSLIDDHLFVSQNANIRSILIIDNNPYKRNPFFKYWHTHQDNVNNIDKRTLKAVGDVILNYVYCVK